MFKYLSYAQTSEIKYKLLVKNMPKKESGYRRKFSLCNIGLFGLNITDLETPFLGVQKYICAHVETH